MPSRVEVKLTSRLTLQMLYLSIFCLTGSEVRTHSSDWVTPGLFILQIAFTDAELELKHQMSGAWWYVPRILHWASGGRRIAKC